MRTSCPKINARTLPLFPAAAIITPPWSSIISRAEPRMILCAEDPVSRFAQASENTLEENLKRIDDLVRRGTRIFRLMFVSYPGQGNDVHNSAQRPTSWRRQSALTEFYKKSTWPRGPIRIPMPRAHATDGPFRWSPRPSMASPLCTGRRQRCWQPQYHCWFWHRRRPPSRFHARCRSHRWGHRRRSLHQYRTRRRYNRC